MRILLIGAITCFCALGQSRLYLQTRVIDPDIDLSVTTASARALEGGRQRWLVQFNGDLPVETLGSRGALILGAVPENGLVLSTFETFDWSGLDVRYRAPIDPADKLSPTLAGFLQSAPLETRSAETRNHYLVMFHEDVAPIDARRIVAQTPLEVREHPNLAANHLMVTGTFDDARALADWDEVAVLLPASEDLISGTPVAYCSGVLLENFPLSPLAGNAAGGGWSTTNGAAQLGISFGAPSKKLSGAAVRAEIERALREWSRVVKVTFNETAASAPRTFNFLFGTGDHGDPYPFTGTSGVIAHAFFPAPPNPEPLAGDVHFNDDMAFRIGADIDLFSVALHEIGHALGLQHTDSSGAVMYPYYKMNAGLSTIDINNIRQLYAANDGSAPTLVLTLNPPPARTNAPTLTLTGSVTGATGAAAVDWKVDRGGAGTANAATGNGAFTATIALADGANEITLTARDTTSARVERKVTVTRSTTTTTPPTGTASLRITDPAASARTTTSTARLAGTSANVRRLTWTNDRGGNGTATPDSTGAWTISGITLAPGDNRLTVNGDGVVSSTITLTLEAPATPTDRTPPQLSITTPASSTTTTQAQIAVRGSASDPSGVAQVIWSNSAGGNGTATGTQSWSADVKLVPGFNTITIRATDTAGNTAWRAVTVNRR